MSIKYSQEQLKNLSQKELIALIQTLTSEKKYGLVWEDFEEPTEEGEISVDILEKLCINLEAKDNIETKKHCIIEGDNLHSLKYLQEEFTNKVDVIYIDPPYNTGKEFVYNDKIVDKEDSFRHSKWLSFMHKRLKLAKQLLSDDGVIFVSIDDNEQAQLKLLMDDIFGEQNFVNNMVWRKGGGKSDSKYLASRKEYILIYKKLNLEGFTQKPSDPKNYREKDDRGIYQLRGFGMQGLTYSPSLDYPIEAPDGTFIYAGGSAIKYKERYRGKYNQKDWCWTLSKTEYKRRYDNGAIIFKKVKGEWKVYYKSYLEGKESPYEDIYTDVTNSTSNGEIKNIFGGSIVFQYTKPTKLIKFLIGLHPKNDVVVLDFFAGSGTTGHAVMQLNEEDGGNRKFILCTNNEVSEEKVRQHFINQGLLDKNTKTAFKKFYEENKELVNEFYETEEYQKLGIARSVTYERLKRVIEGYVTPKGKEVESIKDNSVLYLCATNKNKEENVK